MYVDLAGRGMLELVEPDEPTRRSIERQHRGFPIGEGPTPPGYSAPRVIVETVADPLTPLIELQGPANDDHTTGTDGRSSWLIRAGRRCSIPDATCDAPAIFRAERGFPIPAIYRSAIRPALQVAIARGGACAVVHAASVTISGRAIVVAGWSESGKTETALGLMERGAQFLSDKWTLLGTDGEASAFPITIGIRRWVIQYLPTLARAQTAQSRLQFGAARAAAVGVRPIAALGALVSPAAARGLEKAVQLADRNAYTMAELRAAYGQDDDPSRRVPTRALALLVTIPSGPVSVEDADGDAVAARLARTAAYERRSYLDLLERASYALGDPEGEPARRRAIAQDERVLRDALRSLRVLIVRAPFPTDPRVVADAILEAA